MNKTKESQLAAAARYQKKTRQVMIRLNPDTEADIIEFLEKQENLGGYIKGLIRHEMIRKGEA
jgi:hypothetical protein